MDEEIIKATIERLASRPADESIELLTIQELADTFKKSREAIYQLRHKGGGPPAVKIGRSLRFPRTALVEWLKSQPGGECL